MNMMINNFILNKNEGRDSNEDEIEKCISQRIQMYKHYSMFIVEIQSHINAIVMWNARMHFLQLRHR